MIATIYKIAKTQSDFDSSYDAWHDHFIQEHQTVSSPIEVTPEVIIFIDGSVYSWINEKEIVFESFKVFQEKTPIYPGCFDPYNPNSEDYDPDFVKRVYNSPTAS